MTQRTASTRLDLPQPFGPTTPVSPGSISKSVGSTKDLKPMRRSRVSFIRLLFPFVRCGCKESPNAQALGRPELPAAASARRMNRRTGKRNSPATLSRFSLGDAIAGTSQNHCPATRRKAKKRLSFLEIGVDLLGHHIDGLIAIELLAIDEKGGRRVDAKLLGGAVTHVLDAVEHLLIRQAFVE